MEVGGVRGELRDREGVGVGGVGGPGGGMQGSVGLGGDMGQRGLVGCPPAWVEGAGDKAGTGVLGGAQGGVEGPRVLVQGVGLGGPCRSWGVSAAIIPCVSPPPCGKGQGQQRGAVTFRVSPGPVPGVGGVGSGWNVVPQPRCENPLEGFPSFCPVWRFLLPREHAGAAWCCRNHWQSHRLYQGWGRLTRSPSLPVPARGETEARAALVPAPAERCFAWSLHHCEFLPFFGGTGAWLVLPGIAPPTSARKRRVWGPAQSTPHPGHPQLQRHRHRVLPRPEVPVARGAGTGTGIPGQTSPIWLVQLTRWPVNEGRQLWGGQGPPPPPVTWRFLWLLTVYREGGGCSKGRGR